MAHLAGKYFSILYNHKAQTPPLGVSSSIKKFFQGMPTGGGVVSSCIAGVIGDFVSYPAFNIRTLVQSGKFETIKMAYNAVVQRGFFLGLYRGASISLAVAPAGNFFYLWGMQSSLLIFGNNDFGCTMQGLVAQAYASVIWGPAKRLMELQQMPSSDRFQKLSVLRKMEHICKHEGVTGFYKGLLPQFISFSGTGMLAFWMKKRWMDYTNKDNLSLTEEFVSTATCFSVAAGLLNPVDVTATLMQVNVADSKTGRKELTAREAFLSLYENKGFYRGAGLRSIWLGSKMATMLMVVKYLEDQPNPTLSF